MANSLILDQIRQIVAWHYPGPEPTYRAQSTLIYRADCLNVLRELPDAFVDAVVTDPPYPEIDRPYGRMTELEWHDMMHKVVRECKRVLKPSGSAIFVLAPNSEYVGRMRSWLFDFQA